MAIVIENFRALELKVFTLTQENRRLAERLRAVDPKCDVSYRNNGGSPSNGSVSPSSPPRESGPAKDFGQPGRIELLQENQRLSAEVTRLTKELAAARASKVSSAPEAPSGESRLRALLTSRRTSTSELRSAIAGVEALLSEAKRELSNAELRERRAAYEQLHAAMGEDNEEALAAMIEVAVAAGVDAEELERANSKLNELRNLTPEQKMARTNRKLEASRKQTAFLLVKKDDAKGLQDLLELVEESGVRWSAWKDWSGRSLWRCAQELRSARVQIYLAPKLGLRTQEGPKRPSMHTLADRSQMMNSLSLSGSPSGSPPSGSPTISPIKEKEEAVFEGGICQPGGRRFSGDANESGSNGPFGAIGLGSLGAWPPFHTEDASPGTGSRLTNALVTPRPTARDCLDPATAVASAISNSEAASALITPRVSNPDAGAASNGWSPSTYSSSPAYSPTYPSGISPSGSSSEPFADLKAKALRAVAQDDAVTLRTVLDRVSSGIWSKWENKAGKDLLTLSQERGSSLAYSLLARELGVLKELHREVFEEREAVWVFEVGEVQPRRATVLEDTPEEAEEIYVEFWDGDAPPTYVERCLVRKMA